jgi:hypothetical protein
VSSIGEHRADALEDAVRRTRDPRAQRLHPAREIMRARRFDDRVDVVALDRVVDEAETPAFAGGAEALLQLTHDPHGPKGANVLTDLQRDVTWMP